MSAPRAVTDGRLVDNVVHFAQALRRAGIKVGTAQVETAVRAVAVTGLNAKADFYHTLCATLISRAEDRVVFREAFALFWRDPDFRGSMMQLLLPTMRDTSPPAPKPAAHRRAADALGAHRELPPPPPDTPDDIITDARQSWALTETIRHMDFEQMSAAELAEAERALRSLTLPIPPLLTRRLRPSAHGHRPDARATLARALRRGGEIDRVAMRAPQMRPPDLVAICDISGSMSTYARMILRFLHALSHAPRRDWGAVAAFTFGTRLTNVTRALDHPDPDLALARIGRDASDWDGGTRIGEALDRFNRDWSRRVLTRGAVVLLITDGLERADTALLGAATQRLARSARRLIWLNPLLRWNGFAPEAAGIRAILPHVDSFHACHSIDSLAQLSAALSGPGARDRLLAGQPAAPHFR